MNDLALMTKNHLFFGLLVLKDGRILKDHDRTGPWTVPIRDGLSTKHDELHDALELGLNCLMLDKSIWVHEEVDDIELIITVGNLEQVTGLADHEIHVFSKIGSLMAVEEKRLDQPKKTIFARV